VTELARVDIERLHSEEFAWLRPRQRRALERLARLAGTPVPLDGGSPAPRTAAFVSEPLVCGFCGAPFLPRRTGGRPQRHCSPEHRRLAAARAMLERAGYEVRRP
jgi:hypothetical protein